jgi:hypothetical protein
VPSSTESSILGRLFLTFVTSVNIYQSTRCNLPEVSNFRIFIRLSVFLVNIATVFGVGHLCTRKCGYPLICGPLISCSHMFLSDPFVLFENKLRRLPGTDGHSFKVFIGISLGYAVAQLIEEVLGFDFR